MKFIYRMRRKYGVEKKKEKMLVTNISSFSNNVFHHILSVQQHFIGRLQKLLNWANLNFVW